MSWKDRLFGNDNVGDCNAALAAIEAADEPEYSVGDEVMYIAPCGMSYLSRVVLVNSDGTYNLHIIELDVETLDVHIDDIVDYEELPDE